MAKKWYDKSLGELFSGNPKSYNPFKMWGSYVGLVLILPLLFGLGQLYICQSDIQTDVHGISICEGKEGQIAPGWRCRDGINYGTHADCFTPPTLAPSDFHPDDFLMGGLYYLNIVIYGFLIGWGIHSLIRRIRK